MGIIFKLVNEDTSSLRFQKKAVVDALKNLGGEATMAQMDAEVFRLLTDECKTYMMNGLPFVQSGRRIIDWHSPELITRGFFEKIKVEAPKKEKPLSPKQIAEDAQELKEFIEQSNKEKKTKSKTKTKV